MFGLLLAVIYLSFVSLGLPDSLLGAAWPAMYGELHASLAGAGVISMVIAGGTIFSSLESDRLTKRLGTGRVTAISVAMTAAALFGFSHSRSFAALCVWAVPYGLGAGSVDASLNNYVALHYASRHMNWLHCMWGIGASAGPYIMAYGLTSGMGWHMGYRAVAILQAGLTAVLFISLPLWPGERSGAAAGGERRERPLSLGEILRIPSALEAMAAFFCYCGLEQTAGLWASSYLVLSKGVPKEAAAGYAGLFFVGITASRLLSGFLSIKCGDKTMVRIGQALTGVGVVALMLPGGIPVALGALVVIGLGCAPIYPSLLHATPERFGTNCSQAVIGVEMASAYVGTCAVPPLFGALAGAAGTEWLPVCLWGLLAGMTVLHEMLLRRGRGGQGE